MRIYIWFIVAIAGACIFGWWLAGISTQPPIKRVWIYTTTKNVPLTGVNGIFGGNPQEGYGFKPPEKEPKFLGRHGTETKEHYEWRMRNFEPSMVWAPDPRKYDASPSYDGVIGVSAVPDKKSFADRHIVIHEKEYTYFGTVSDAITGYNFDLQDYWSDDDVNYYPKHGWGLKNGQAGRWRQKEREGVHFYGWDAHNDDSL